LAERDQRVATVRALNTFSILADALETGLGEIYHYATVVNARDPLCYAYRLRCVYETSAPTFVDIVHHAHDLTAKLATFRVPHNTNKKIVSNSEYVASRGSRPGGWLSSHEYLRHFVNYTGTLRFDRVDVDNGGVYREYEHAPTFALRLGNPPSIPCKICRSLLGPHIYTKRPRACIQLTICPPLARHILVYLRATNFDALRPIPYGGAPPAQHHQRRFPEPTPYGIKRSHGRLVAKPVEAHAVVVVAATAAGGGSEDTPPPAPPIIDNNNNNNNDNDSGDESDDDDDDAIDRIEIAASVGNRDWSPLQLLAFAREFPGRIPFGVGHAVFDTFQARTATAEPFAFTAFVTNKVCNTTRRVRFAPGTTTSQLVHTGVRAGTLHRIDKQNPTDNGMVKQLRNVQIFMNRRGVSHSDFQSIARPQCAYVTNVILAGDLFTFLAATAAIIVSEADDNPAITSIDSYGSFVCNLNRVTYLQGVMTSVCDYRNMTLLLRFPAKMCTVQQQDGTAAAAAAAAAAAELEEGAANPLDPRAISANYGYHNRLAIRSSVSRIVSLFDTDTITVRDTSLNLFSGTAASTVTGIIARYEIDTRFGALLVECERRYRQPLPACFKHYLSCVYIGQLLAVPLAIDTAAAFGVALARAKTVASRWMNIDHVNTVARRTDIYGVGQRNFTILKRRSTNYATGHRASRIVTLAAGLSPRNRKEYSNTYKRNATWVQSILRLPNAIPQRARDILLYRLETAGYPRTAARLGQAFDQSPPAARPGRLTGEEE